MELKNEYVDERTGITYTLKGDYYFPNLSIPKDTNFAIGRYGKAHLRHIKQYNKPLYTDLLLDGKLNKYLHSIDEKCNSLLESIIKSLNNLSLKNSSSCIFKPKQIRSIVKTCTFLL